MRTITMTTTLIMEKMMVGMVMLLVVVEMKVSAIRTSSNEGAAKEEADLCVAVADGGTFD